jgi:HEAT repeat protein
MHHSLDEQDVRVRAAVYDGAISSGTLPSIQDLARQLALSREDVEGSLERREPEIGARRLPGAAPTASQRRRSFLLDLGHQGRHPLAVGLRR